MLGEGGASFTWSFLGLPELRLPSKMEITAQSTMSCFCILLLGSASLPQQNHLFLLVCSYLRLLNRCKVWVSDCNVKLISVSYYQHSDWTTVDFLGTLSRSLFKKWSRAFKAGII